MAITCRFIRMVRTVRLSAWSLSVRIRQQKDAVINRILGSIVMAVIVIMLVCIAFAMKMALSMSSNIQSSIQVVEELAQGNLKCMGR